MGFLKVVLRAGRAHMRPVLGFGSEKRSNAFLALECSLNHRRTAEPPPPKNECRRRFGMQCRDGGFRVSIHCHSCAPIHRRHSIHPIHIFIQLALVTSSRSSPSRPGAPVPLFACDPPLGFRVHCHPPRNSLPSHPTMFSTTASDGNELFSVLNRSLFFFNQSPMMRF